MKTVQQLFTVEKETERIFLNDEVLEQLLQNDIKDDKIVVISVAGEFRIGKSFLLSICQKYLDFTYDKNFESKTSVETWMSDESEPLEGFRWERGTESVTSGAQMSKIFRTTLADEEKVVIILLDTQGTSDHNTTTSVNTKIFGLSTMVSSVQIFFVKDHIVENHLKELKFFTDYGSMVQDQNENTTISPYQQLLFYVRDWPNAHQYPYGYVGGERYLETVLRIRDNQKEELQSIREWIGKCFKKRECFLMPHPGEKITSFEFDGKFADMKSSYKTHLNEFIPHLLARENLGQLLKEINGNAVTVSQFVWYLREYTNTMNSRKLPNPKDFIYMNIQLSQQLCKEEMRRKYEEKIEQMFASAQEKKPTPTDIDHILQSADEDFKKFPKFGDPSTTETNWKKLRNEIERYWNKLRKTKEKIDVIEKEVHEKDKTVEKLTNELEEEKKRSNKKAVLGAAMGVGVCALGVGTGMIAGPAALVQAGIFAAENIAVATGIAAASGGAVVCELKEEVESSKRKIVMGAAMGAGACAVGIGAAMIAGPAVLVHAGIFTAESTAVTVGVATAGGGATTCVGSGIALKLKSNEIKNVVETVAEVGVAVGRIVSSSSHLPK